MAAAAIAEETLEGRTETIFHVAGPVLRQADFMGQPCLRCGFMLVSYDLQNIAVAADENGEFHPPAAWGEGDRIAHGWLKGVPEDRGGMWSVADHDPGEPFEWALPHELRDPTERWCTA